jgi:outer membrane biosynthesis protein TonB
MKSCIKTTFKNVEPKKRKNQKKTKKKPKKKQKNQKRKKTKKNQKKRKICTYCIFSFDESELHFGFTIKTQYKPLHLFFSINYTINYRVEER